MVARIDLIGRTEVRRTERALPGEYRVAVVAALPRLSADTLPALVALASVARFRAALAAAVQGLS